MGARSACDDALVLEAKRGNSRQRSRFLDFARNDRQGQGESGEEVAVAAYGEDEGAADVEGEERGEIGLGSEADPCGMTTQGEWCRVGLRRRGLREAMRAALFCQETVRCGDSFALLRMTTKKLAGRTGCRGGKPVFIGGLWKELNPALLVGSLMVYAR